MATGLGKSNLECEQVAEGIYYHCLLVKLVKPSSTVTPLQVYSGFKRKRLSLCE